MHKQNWRSKNRDNNRLIYLLSRAWEMASESELCVDKLLQMNSKIDGLCEKLESNNEDELIETSRSVLSETQMYIDNNRSSIPPYILKKVSDSLRRLEKYTSGPNKSKLTFKFNSKPSRSSTKPVIEREVHATPAKKTEEPVVTSLGFKNKTNEELTLGPGDIDSKDVSLVDLDKCKVRIFGLANTVYVKCVKNSTITIYLACRAITIRECTDCHFKLVCQQLRIDSTNDCHFNIFTSARSMLESSTGLTFSRLNFDELTSANAEVRPIQLSDLLERAKFNRLQNNWNCVDDFDWLSPDKPSKNFNLCDSIQGNI